MLHVYYTYLEDSFSIPELSLFSDYRQSRIKQTSDELRKKQGAAGELLLYYAVKRIYPEETLPLNIVLDKGKAQHADRKFFFNISHSDNIIACAVSDMEVGIDVQVEKKYNPQIAARFFSPYENELLIKAAEPDKLFFKLWCMKESYVKMLGNGISYGLQSFSVDPLEMKTNDSSACFWYSYGNGFHLSVCCRGEKQLMPDIYEYVPLKTLL